MERSDRSSRCVSETPVISKSLGPEVLGQDDVDGVREGQIEPDAPGVGEQPADLSNAQRPSVPFGHRRGDLV
jgi:hypothetical protein